MKTTLRLILLLLFFITSSVAAKNLNVEWAKQIFSDKSVTVDDIQTDKYENIYVCGEFEQNIYFGDGTTFNSKGVEGIFLAKYSSFGKLLWAKHISLTLNGHCRSICFDEYNEVYICGAFVGTATFNNVDYLFSSYVWSGYISKYSADGVEQWVAFVSAGRTVGPMTMHCDQQGFIYTTGEYSARTDFGNGNIIPNFNGCDCYTAKYNYDGVCQWVSGAGGNGGERGYCLDTDNDGNVYNTGYCSSQMDFGNNIKTQYVGPSNNRDAFLVKYNDKGVCLWAKSIVGPNRQGTGTLTVDNDGNIFLVSSSQDDLNLGNGITLSVPEGKTDFIFVAKFDTDGVCQWAKQIFYPGISELKYFQDELYFCGALNDTLDMGSAGILSNSGYKDALVFNTDTDGNINWGKNLTDVETSAAAGDISVFDKNSIYISGNFTEDFLIDGKFDFILTGERDAFIAKLTPGIAINGDSLICDSDEAILTASDGFDTYEWSTGETTQSIVVTESGEYTVSATDEDNNVYHSESFSVRIVKTQIEGLNNVSLKVSDLSDSDQQTLVFENKGSDPVSVISIELKDSNPDFEITTSVNLPVLLPVGDSFDIVLTYTPETEGEVSDSLIVIIDEPCPVTIMRLGKGISSVCHLSAFNYPNFSSIDKLNLIESSPTDSSIVLTWTKQKDAGAMWRNERVPVKNGFYCKFRFRLSKGENYNNEDGSLPGADGIAFVIQNSDPKALGSTGGRIGYAGIKNALAIELDLFSNDENQIEDYFDPNGNHIAVQTGGTGVIDCIHTEENNLGISSEIPVIQVDGTIYTMLVEYNLEPDVLNIYLAENISSVSPALTLTDLKLDEILDLDKGEGAYVGITAATGAAAQTHEILDWEFCPSNSEYVGIEDNLSTEKELTLRISPNPGRESVNLIIPMQNTDSRVNIYDLLGNKLLAQDVVIVAGQTVVQLDVIGFAAGAYVLRVNVNDMIMAKNLMIR